MNFKTNHFCESNSSTNTRYRLNRLMAPECP